MYFERDVLCYPSNNWVLFMLRILYYIQAQIVLLCQLKILLNMKFKLQNNFGLSQIKLFCLILVRRLVEFIIISFY